MRKKMATVLLTLVVAASSILGGCGAPQETSGRAEGTEQTGEPEETGQSEERQETQNDSDHAGNEESEILEFVGGDESEEDEPERLVRPENLALIGWSEYEYDESGNKTKYTYYRLGISVIGWNEYEYDKSGNQTKKVQYDSDGSIFDWWEYEYNESGNCIKANEYRNTIQ